ncbi:hypothetical protein VB834_15555 [Limnoraphis robusta Tam1]|uniref:hypothetical protein n=1 Tax=Limnoraphis robusta TaxID=1118279 RepID=UPI002B1ED843|nr:hypothetical protein [Limnoraphis robusta]MEA5540441.1 hypothetical protein [Limnoraphis robusta Tam1]
MQIADLNHLETVEANVTGARGRGGRDVKTFYENAEVRLKIYTDIALEGNSAEVDGVSEAKGNNSFSKINFFTYADGHSSLAAVNAFSAVK